MNPPQAPRDLVTFEATQKCAVFTPYYNRWNENAYTRSTEFAERPWAMEAGSTSGAAVAVGDRVFAGLTRPGGGEFRWDGRKLSVSGSAGDIFWREGLPAPQAWREYHAALRLPRPSAPWGGLPEYNTWVEQVRRRSRHRLPGAALSNALINELLDAIDSQNWPRGRFTVDEGWGPRHGPGGYGTWEPKARIDPALLAARITARGHIPGLWLAPALICPHSNAAREFPDAVGARVAIPGETPWNRFHFLRPGRASAVLIKRLFRRAWGWGFRKLKLDLMYGRRDDMLALAKQCRDAAQHLPGVIELEGHVADPFIAAYFDVIRINDVLISQKFPAWREVVTGHFDVCAASAPSHMLCLDHIGGNLPAVSATEFIQHARMMNTQLERGYPVVGLLPMPLGKEATRAVSELLRLSQIRHASRAVVM